MAVKLIHFLITASALLAAAAHADTGESLYNTQCRACHQSNGGGNEALKAPAIAGLNADYIQRQLQHFRDGLRGDRPDDAQGTLMAGIAKTLSDEQIGALAQHMAAQPFVAAAAPPPPEGFGARNIYSACASCHGGNADGVDSLGAPRLAGQHSWYLKAQLEKFRNGVRGAHAEDTHGQQMRSMALKLKPDEIETIIRYVGNLGR